MTNTRRKVKNRVPLINKSVSIHDYIYYPHFIIDRTLDEEERKQIFNYLRDIYQLGELTG